MRAGDILSYKTNFQPLLGDFKLKYEETEKSFCSADHYKNFDYLSKY